MRFKISARRMITLLATIAVFGALAATASASVLSNLQGEIAGYNGIAKTAVWVEASGGGYFSGICSSHLKYYSQEHYSNGNKEWSYDGAYWSNGVGWNIQGWTSSSISCNPNNFSGIYGF